jgi:IS605 OrfB family transposase
MLLVERHIIKESNALYKELDEMCFKSKNLYNLTNYHIRQEFFLSGNILSYNSLDKKLQSTEAYLNLPAKVSQQVLMQVSRDWRSWQEAKSEYVVNPTKFKANPRIPSYKDKQLGRNLLIYTEQAISRKQLKKGYINFSKTKLKITTKKRRINQVRIVPQSNYYIVEVVYERLICYENVEKTKVAAIDIGVNNLAAVTSNVTSFQALLINGRPLKAINSNYNKEKAALQKLLGKGLFSSKAIENLTFNRNMKVDNYLHQTSRFIIDTLINYQIGTLVIGKNDEWKQEINLGKANNQNFTFIPHAKFISMLKYKAELAAISVVVLEQSYTSKCSFLDMEPIHKHSSYKGKRIKRGLFRSSTGKLLNADVNGSLNILRKAFPDAFGLNPLEKGHGIMDCVVNPVRVNTVQMPNFCFSQILTSQLSLF